MRSDFGKMIHNRLLAMSESRLKREGYRVIRSAKFAAKGVVCVDLLGTNNKETVGVQCVVRPYKRLVEDTEKSLSRFVDKVIFAIPDFTKFKPENSWVFSIEIKMRAKR